MNTAKVTSKGQVTIPKRVRSLMAIRTGDRLAFDLDENGCLRVSRVRGEGRPLRGLLSEYGIGGKVDAERVRYALRLLASLKTEAEKVAAAEGTTLNQFINVAVAEKLAALRTARYFEERASRANLDVFARLMETAGDEPPRPGDELLASPKL